MKSEKRVKIGDYVPESKVKSLCCMFCLKTSEDIARLLKDTKKTSTCSQNLKPEKFGRFCLIHYKNHNSF